MKKDPTAHTLHPRSWRNRRFVYVARSRRARGLSLGINLDPQKTCNFDCVYCEVIDRKEIVKKTGRPPIDLGVVLAELEAELGHWEPPDAASGETLADIAFAGDGEPSTFKEFDRLAELVFDARDRFGFGRLPVVLITNGSGLDRDVMVRAHGLFASRGGVFWIKLDAGTEEFFRAVCRTAIPFSRILHNLETAARRHPVVVQSMFFRFNGKGPDPSEIEMYATRLRTVIRNGGRILGVQIYTVARETMERGIEPLGHSELELIAREAMVAVGTGCAVDVFP